MVYAVPKWLASELIDKRGMLFLFSLVLSRGACCGVFRTGVQMFFPSILCVCARVLLSLLILHSSYFFPDSRRGEAHFCIPYAGLFVLTFFFVVVVMKAAFFTSRSTCSTKRLIRIQQLLILS
jgi:hypothetical protein